MGTFGKVVLGGLLGGAVLINALSALGGSLENEFEAQANADMTDVSPADADLPIAQRQDASESETGSATDEQIAGCKAALALMNGRDVSIFAGRRLDRDTVHVEWRSPDDGKLWEARCAKAGNNALRWAAYNAFGDGQQGRWRNEDTIKTEVEGGRIVVRLTQPGLGEKRASYNLSELS